MLLKNKELTGRLFLDSFRCISFYDQLKSLFSMFNFYFDSSLCTYFHSRLFYNQKQMFSQPKSWFYLFFGLGTYMGFSFWYDFVFPLLSDALCGVFFFPSSTCLTFYSLPLLISSEKAPEKAPEPELEPEPFDNTTYKNLQHHNYDMYTFADMDVEMAKHRLPQPSAGRHWVFIVCPQPCFFPCCFVLQMVCWQIASFML